MKRILRIPALLFAMLSPSLSSAQGEFVPVDPSTLDTVDGEVMLVIAYGVIAGLIAIYSLRLFLEQKKVQKKTAALLSRLEETGE